MGLEEINELLLIRSVSSAHRFVLTSNLSSEVIASENALSCLIVDPEDMRGVLDSRILHDHVLYQLVPLFVADNLVAAQ